METQHEQWKAIAECNGEYYISDHGRVKSYKGGKERIMNGAISNGYRYVHISYSCNHKLYKLIHRLVALSFIENPENKPEVNHKDGNKLNNHIDNLEWVTSKENKQHGWNTGLCESVRLAASKKVIDITNGKKYLSLKLACKDTNQSYTCHKQRTLHKSKLQRFFYINDNGNG
jgi:hypothetical protein